ncbi:hypothetical protein MML48_2g00013704 [Holotrichia oblita]|uniref:Uncharacterized protein n=1 Tax=Holotrichia oblita TaxID=644536 RepID=A0ACB9TMG1_HOLOL|nr:hypothetical protein MML48_2g00013704 [Holotrichia oblita]
MPSENEFVAIQTNFYATASFPRVIGTIDCTHIKIQSPGGIDAEIFRNRKSYFSINVQAIANADMIFTDIVARWPGSVHDSTIFNNTAIKKRFEEGEFTNNFLLGKLIHTRKHLYLKNFSLRDSGYPLRNYLLTPLANPVARAEQLYNESHIRTRNCIERVFGLWKRRFPVLAYGLRLKLDTILTVIIATAVLHNIAREMHEDLPEPPEDLNVDELNYLIATGNINEVISNIMPRRFIHKLGTSHRRDYPRERLENALRAVIEEHMSFGQAAEQFSVPKATLYDKYRGMHGDLLGRKPAMSVAEGRYIVTALLKAAEFIVPFTEKDLMDFGEQYITRKVVMDKIKPRSFALNEPGTVRALEESFTQIITEKTTLTEKTISTRRKKIDVPAGQSVTVTNLLEQERSTTRLATTSETVDEEDVDIISAGSSPQESFDDAKTIDDPMTDFKYQISKPCDIKKGCFVICSFIYDKGTKKEIDKCFVAKILEIKKSHSN